MKQNAKLVHDQVRFIRQLYDDGYGLGHIRKILKNTYGITMDRQYLGRIVKRKSWVNVY
jgi:hypothetical protein